MRAFKMAPHRGRFELRLSWAAIAFLCIAIPIAVAADDNGLARATALHEQVVQLSNAGHYADAIPIAKDALAIREKVLGPDHSDVATSLANLAGVYEREGRYAEVETLYKRSLAIREKALGLDHPLVANSLSYLALLYADQARYAEAEALFKRSLDIREKTLGSDHPDIATTLNNLAQLYFRQHRYAEALDFSRWAVAVLGERLARSDPRSTGGEAERREERSYFLTNVKLVYVVGEPSSGGLRVRQMMGKCRMGKRPYFASFR